MTVDELREALATKVLDLIASPTTSKEISEKLEANRELVQGLLHQLKMSGKASVYEHLWCRVGRWPAIL